jgi:hypothetical protein
MVLVAVIIMLLREEIILQALLFPASIKNLKGIAFHLEA